MWEYLTLLGKFWLIWQLNQRVLDYFCVAPMWALHQPLRLCIGSTGNRFVFGTSSIPLDSEIWAPSANWDFCLEDCVAFAWSLLAQCQPLCEPFWLSVNPSWVLHCLLLVSLYLSDAYLGLWWRYSNPTIPTPHCTNSLSIHSWQLLENWTSKLTKGPKPSANFLKGHQRNESLLKFSPNACHVSLPLWDQCIWNDQLHFLFQSMPT